MLRLRVNVDVEVAEVTQEPVNTLIEFDQIAKLFGTERFKGEGIKDFVESAVGSVSLGYEDPYNVQELLAHETRQGVGYCVLNQSRDDIAITLEVSPNQNLLIKVFDLAKQELSSEYEYDLLDRTLYPFFDDLISRINLEVNDLLFYRTSLIKNERDMSLLPSMLIGNQSNIENNSFFPLRGKKIVLEDKKIIPTSIEFDTLNLSVEERRLFKVVKDLSDLKDKFDVYVDCINGRVHCYEDLSKYRITIFYDYIVDERVYRYSKGVFAVPLGDPETLTSFINSERGLMKEVSYNSDGSVAKSRRVSSIFVPHVLMDSMKRESLWDKEIKRYS